MFRWVAELDTDAAQRLGGERSYRSPDFPTQAEAEAWLTESYEDLVDDGLDEVTLVEGDRVVYAPMSLHA